MTIVTLRDRKKSATRARIVSEARTLFGERGIQAVTVDDIAAAAEIGKGTLYNYFRAKEDIVVDVLIDLEREVLAALPALADRDAPAGEILDEAVWRLLDAKRDHRPFVRAFMARLFAGDESFVDGLAEFQATLDTAYAALFDGLKARGRLPAGLDTAELVLALKTLHLGLSSLWAIEGPPYATARHLTRLHTDLFAKGLLR